MTIKYVQQQHLNGSEELLSRKNVIEELWVVLNGVGFQINLFHLLLFMFHLHLHLLLVQLLQQAIIIFLQIWLSDW